MKSLLAALAFTTALTLPGLVMAKTVTITTQMNTYRGNPAFLAYYLTDAKGGYVRSLWMAGGRARYYEHLTAWSAAVGGDYAEIDGITGASVGSGQTLTLQLDLEDSLFDAGYVLHIDSAVEQMREAPNEIAVPLSTADNGKTAKGRRYVAAFSYAF
jgi:hypothetical protein